MNDYDDLTRLLDEKDAEINRLRHRVHECGYCDYVATACEPSAARREMTRHIATCEKHPLGKAQLALARAHGALRLVGRWADVKNVQWDDGGLAHIEAIEIDEEIEVARAAEEANLGA